MNIITTREQLDEMVAYYLKQPAFAFDCETVGPRRGVPVINEVLWLSFATYGRGDVIPMGHPNGDLLEVVRPFTSIGARRAAKGLPLTDGDYIKDPKKYTYNFSNPPSQLYPAEVFDALKPLFFSDVLKVGHNLVFDLCSVAKYFDGSVPSGPYFDTMVGSFVYDNRNKNKCGLDDCLKRELNYTMEKGVGAQVEIHAFNVVAKYAYLDAKYTFMLWKVVDKKIKEAGVENIMNLEMDVLRVLCDMKLAGAPLDQEALVELHKQLDSDIERVRGEIYEAAGTVFNINSNREKQQLLYSPAPQGRGLKPKIYTGKGLKKDAEGGELSVEDYSVSAEALEPYREKDPLVNSLLTYSDLNKLLTTYVIPYLGGEVVRTTGGKAKIEHRDSLLVNGKVHGDFIQHGADTGRFSSRNPNLQNVPNPATAHGKAIRNLFYAPEGYKLVVADYSQIEPRIIASMSMDPIMMKNYLEGGDIYTTVGDVMGVNRQAGKVLVLSMAYGVGPDKIARSIGCSVTEAKGLLSDFADKFQNVASYRAKVVGVAKKTGFVSTILGRKRYLPEINSRNIAERAGAERQAFNTRIQGSAADVMKLAMIRAHKAIPQGASILLTVHDELVTITPDDLVDQTREAIRESMEGINLLEVPLIADVKVVQRWGEAK
jgi:DNA polymerase I-like protein with 3'-5' exonuclease and polymerase domains